MIDRIRPLSEPSEVGLAMVSRSSRAAGVLAIVLTVVGACGSNHEGAAGSSGPPTSSATQSPPTSAAGPGTEQVQVNGHDLHADCVPGPGPTVVFLHGAGGRGRDWAGTITDLDGFSTCTYDRFNVGASGTDAQRHSPVETAEDLEGLLQATGMSPPYILVGHSWGGLLALIEAGRHPEQIAGLVLVDATLPFETELDPPELADEVRADMNTFEPGLDAYEGYAEARLVGHQLPDVPMTFIYADKFPGALPWPAADYERRLNAWVHSWNQGRLVTCDCSHAVPREAPDLIADQVRAVSEASE